MADFAVVTPWPIQGELSPLVQVEDEELAAHRIILTARSPVFRALLNSDMREGKEGVVVIEDVRAPVFRALLHFVYTDMLPEVGSRISEDSYQPGITQHSMP